MKKKWVQPEIRSADDSFLIELRVYNTLRELADSIDHHLVYHWHPPLLPHPETCADHCPADECKYTPSDQLKLKDDPRCRTKLGG